MRNYYMIRQQAKNPGTVELYLYGTIEGDWYDWWSGKLIESETSATHIRKQLQAYGDLRRVEVHINSMGGSVREANAIANMLRRLDAETVAYIDAFACSAASAIACACKQVIMPRNTVLMIHNPWMEAVGNAGELRKVADDLDVLGEAFRTIYLDKAGDKLDEKQLIKMLDAETYLTAEQAYEYGLCDEIETFDAVMQEPSGDDRQAAAKLKIDLGKICAMVRGEAKPEPQEPPETEPEQTDETKPEPEKSPETTEKSEQKAAERAEALILKFFN